jgi:hypothetical protein
MADSKGGSGTMGETVGLDSVLARILVRAREEYMTLEDQELLLINPGEQEIYFRHSTLLKQLISSIESFLDENHRLDHLRESLHR